MIENVLTNIDFDAINLKEHYVAALMLIATDEGSTIEEAHSGVAALLEHVEIIPLFDRSSSGIH